jgi:hypothetical protein
MYMSAQEQSNKLEAIAIRGFIIFSGDRLLFPKSGADRVASVMQLSCRTRGKFARNHLISTWKASSGEPFIVRRRRLSGFQQREGFGRCGLFVDAMKT